MSKLIALLSVFIFAIVFTKNAEAKVLPQSTKAVSKTTTKSIGATIGVYPKMRADRKALIINFSNLQNATAVSYSLTYKTSVQEEAAMGGINLNGQSNAKEELLFGTCSKNVCRYHSNIANAKLEVSYTATSGKKYIKKFRIKV